MAVTIKQDVIDELVKQFNPKRIIHFGSSLDKPIYNDIDLFVEIDQELKMFKPIAYALELSAKYGEEYDLTLVPDADRIIRLLVIEKYEIIYVKQ